MRTGHLLFSAVHFLVVFFLIAVGVFLIALPHAPHFWLSLTAALTEAPELFTKFGWGILVFGFFLFVGLYFLNRRHFIRFQSEGVKISVDEMVIQKSVHDHIKTFFPDIEMGTDVAIKGKDKLEIIIYLPQIQEEEEVWQRVENELGTLLHDLLGYRKEFYLTLASKSL